MCKTSINLITHPFSSSFTHPIFIKHLLCGPSVIDTMTSLPSVLKNMTSHEHKTLPMANNIFFNSNILNILVFTGFRKNIIVLFLQFNIYNYIAMCIKSVQFSHSVVSNSLWPHGLQHERPPCPSPTQGA